MKHDLTAAMKRATTIEDAVAVGWAKNRIEALEMVIDDIINYCGGARNAVEDEYVMARARAVWDGDVSIIFNQPRGQSAAEDASSEGVNPKSREGL